MGSRPGPPPLVLMLGEHPVLDRYVVPCSCRHAYRDHTRYGGPCKGLDSYGCPCTCPGYDCDENDLHYLPHLMGTCRIVEPIQADYR